MFSAYFQRKREAKEEELRKEAHRLAQKAILTSVGLLVSDGTSYGHCEYCRENTHRVVKPHEVISPTGEVFRRETDIGHLCCRCSTVGTEEIDYRVLTSKGVPTILFAETHVIKPLTRELYVSAYETLTKQVKYVSDRLRELPMAETPFRS